MSLLYPEVANFLKQSGTNMARYPCSLPLFYISCLISASNRQQHQSFPDCTQAEGVTCCHGAFRSYLLFVSPLDFFIPVFVLCVFADGCCDNYNKDCAAGTCSEVSHWAIVLFIGWLKKTDI